MYRHTNIIFIYLSQNNINNIKILSEISILYFTENRRRNTFYIERQPTFKLTSHSLPRSSLLVYLQQHGTRQPRTREIQKRQVRQGITPLITVNVHEIYLYNKQSVHRDKACAVTAENRGDKYIIYESTDHLSVLILIKRVQFKLQVHLKIEKLFNHA